MPEVSSLRPEDPRSLGSYRLTGRLGEGGQGVVYLGETSGGSLVAVKVLRPEWTADARSKDRFAKEVAAARRVSPFCVAQVLDANVTFSPPYVVTEFVDGPTLLDSVRAEGPRSGPALHRLAVATATALAAIHEAGVVHRDFKPANVLLGSDGPRVIDFGIARTVDGSATLTGGIVGTPSYMAPEQFEEGAIGPAADVFAWGCVIVFAATGRSPFAGDSVAAITRRVLLAEPDLGVLPGDLRDIVAASLSKEESARPAARDILLRLLGRPGAAPAPIGETLAVGRQAVYGSAPTNPVTPRTPRRAAAITAGAVVAAGAVIAALLVLPHFTARSGGSGPPSPSSSASSVPAGSDQGGLSRTPRLGMEFWQDGAQDAMSLTETGGKDVVTVTMKPAPFELHFPKPGTDVAVQVCAWNDASIFTPADGGKVADSPFFMPGTGIADYEYGSGTLYLDDHGHNYLAGTRIASLSPTEDKVYFAQTGSGPQTTPLRQRTADIFLTVFVDKNKDGVFNVTSPAEFEFLDLRF